MATPIAPRYAETATPTASTPLTRPEPFSDAAGMSQSTTAPPLMTPTIPRKRFRAADDQVARDVHAVIHVLEEERTALREELMVEQAAHADTKEENAAFAKKLAAMTQERDDALADITHMAEVLIKVNETMTRVVRDSERLRAESRAGDPSAVA